MSLIRIAVRRAAVEALRGRTLVGDNVLPSEIGAIEARDDAVGINQTAPFIAVYTDEAECVESALRGLMGNGMTNLLFEMGITAPMAVIDDDTGESLVAGIPATDENFETILDLLARQIMVALSGPGQWATIFRDLTMSFGKVRRHCSRTDESNHRVAAHQINIEVMLMPDPVGPDDIADGTAMGRFLAALRDVDASLADMIVQSVEAAPDWEQVRSRLGMTEAGLLAAGIGPLKNDVDRSTPEFVTPEVEMGLER